MTEQQLAHTSRARGTTLRSLRVREAVAGYLFVLPTLVGFLAFTVGPMLFSFGISLFEWEVLTPPRFVGTANYAFMLRNERFLNGFRNTLLFALVVVAVNVAISLLLAVAIQRRLPTLLRAYYRTAFFLPLVISTASVAIVLSFVFNREFGIANYYLGLLGIGPIPWLTSSSWAMTTVVIATVWKSFGFDLIVFVAGLQSVPRHLYDAAAIDGANGWQQFWRITLPLLSPTIFFATVVGVIGNLQVFDQAYILTKGGPGDATRTVVMVIYDDAFGTLRMGYGSAIAAVLFVLIMTLTLAQFALGRRLVHYG
jgi:multiple sugar transport system permease protein